MRRSKVSISNTFLLYNIHLAIDFGTKNDKTILGFMGARRVKKNLEDLKSNIPCVFRV
jgi:hypothetical protein